LREKREGEVEVVFEGDSAFALPRDGMMGTLSELNWLMFKIIGN